MAYFRVIRIRKSSTTSEEGWAVERTTLGELGRLVTPIFSHKADAKAEADRLAAQETAGKP